MKLRQRLAMALATTMIITAMPITTMGASTNRVTKIVASGNTGTALGDKAPELVIDLKDGWSDSDFYLDLENAEWEDNVFTTPQVYGFINGVQVPIANFERLSNREVRIQKNPKYQGYTHEIEEIRISLKNTVLKGGEAIVTIDSNDSELTSGKYVFAKTVEDKATVDINLGQKEYEIYEQGEIAEIKVSEIYAGQLCESSNPEDRTIRIELNNPRIEFVKPSEENIVLERGLSGLEDIQIRYGKNDNGEENRQIIEVELPYTNTYARGNIIFRGLEVIKRSEDSQTGDLIATVSGSRVEPSTGEVATIRDIKDVEIIEFKDNNFKQALIDEGVDFNQDGEITIGEMGKITSLSINNKQIKDIEGIEYAVNLERLDLAWNEITDITPIKNLVKLKSLDLWTNNITHINQLEQLIELEHLNIGQNPITDITVISKFKKVQELWLSSIQVQDVSILKELPSLTFLNLGVCGIDNDELIEVSKLTQLTNLALHDNPITDISCLRNLNNLTWLGISDCNITSIDVLKNLQKLQGLYLGRNPITDISVLSSLINLQMLGLDGCSEITDFSHIQNLKELELLYLSDTGIEDINILEDLSKLNYVTLNNNNITDISYLPDNYYSYLNLSYNYLDIGFNSESMKKLDKLIELGGNVEYSPQYEKAKSSNASLQNLTIDKGTLSPSFNGNVMNYSVTVGNEVESVKVDAISEDEKATIIGAGEKALKVGENRIDIVVTAEDEVTTKTYTLVVTRAELPKPSTGGGGGGGGGTIKPPTLEQTIDKLKDEDKQTIISNFKERVPYTSLEDSLTIEQLRILTNNLFTDKQLQEMLENPEILQGLNIDLTTLNTKVILSPIKNANFKDVPEQHWANKSIKKVAELGLVAGMPDGTFAPSAPLQVADTFTFLDRVLLLNGINDMKLSRSVVEKYITNKEYWAFANMASIGAKLSEETLQVVSRVGDNPISRELLAQVLYEVTDGKLPEVNASIEFQDVKGSAYRKAIDYCIRTGLLNGISEEKMLPEKALTRAELMTVLIRLDEAIK